MGSSSVNKRFLGIIFPVPVSNTFIIYLRKRLVDKILAPSRIKITLVSIYDDEFVVETDNFIKRCNFEIKLLLIVII
ncbi:hypothetical protein [Borrelia venezuelensis]|uniref:hypothetical protein n=1 Tax=Borrelia venezuelensis TaxID=1653839 RepID=UPI0024C036AC|nr:hypothetical protein [Borrelia venezuelensis]UPA12658.1 hypothetical protein bvRMA01_000992 [Borrelia venezuelensis]